MKTLCPQTTVHSTSAKPLIPEKLKSRICRFPLPFYPDQDKIWTPHFILNGFSATMNQLSCHVSALDSGESPHPPHKHAHEEILVILRGEAELLLPENVGAEKFRIKAGNFAYYPAQFAHSLRTVSVEPANYLMFKWIGRVRKGGEQLGFELHEFFGIDDHQEKRPGFKTSMIFQGPTSYLTRIHCHSSVLAPGAGYNAHKDEYDVAIILLEGEVETLGVRLEPHCLIYYRAGEPHGMNNPGIKVAKYLVFEFHSRRKTIFTAINNFLIKVRDPERWKRKTKHWIHLLK